MSDIRYPKLTSKCVRHTLRIVLNTSCYGAIYLHVHNNRVSIVLRSGKVLELQQKLKLPRILPHLSEWIAVIANFNVEGMFEHTFLHVSSLLLLLLLLLGKKRFQALLAFKIYVSVSCFISHNGRLCILVKVRVLSIHFCQKHKDPSKSMLSWGGHFIRLSFAFECVSSCWSKSSSVAHHMKHLSESCSSLCC